MRRRIVKKFHYQRVPFQGLLHDAALHARPPAMDEPHVAQAGGMRFIQVFFDDRRDVARGEGVKVEDAFDGEAERVLIVHRQVVAGFS